MMDSASQVRLVVKNRSENVTLVRAMIAGFAAGTDISESALNGLRTAVSEASNNVVIHAYGDAIGPLSVAITKRERGTDVLVEDEGCGIRRVAPSSNRIGMGLAVISSLADRAEFSSRAGGGTAVHLRFASGGVGGSGVGGSGGSGGGGGGGEAESTALADEPAPEPHLDEPAGVAGDVVVALSPARLLSPVLGRLSRALAAQAHFSVQHITELRQVTDTITAELEAARTAAPIVFALTATPHRLELSIGPFRPGTASGALAALGAATPSTPGDLVQKVAIHSSGSGEMLSVAVSDGILPDSA